MSYYQRHIFFCINQRDDPSRPCCANTNAVAMQQYAKQRVKELALNASGQVRVNQAGCLDRCEQGSVAVVYPEAIWYSYVDEQDIDEIVESHLRDGQPVKRLQI